MMPEICFKIESKRGLGILQSGVYLAITYECSFPSFDKCL